jgi:1,4-alpha-glucan branching enzyme
MDVAAFRSRAARVPAHAPPAMPEFDQALFRFGQHRHAWRWLGAHTGQGTTRFTVWAPHAAAVAVAGDFNQWDGSRTPLQRLGNEGLWTGLAEGAKPGARYKFAIVDAHGHCRLKADPYARETELRPATASVVPTASRHAWGDLDWMIRRAATDWSRAPVSIYEVHLGSWQRAADGGFLDYRQLARRLVPYVQARGFTHIELMPLAEHPLDASWGYQGVGHFAPTRRFGRPDDLRWFVDHCHRHGIGVLLDWCPAHFPEDDAALARFDGEPLYEHPDPRRGRQPQWQTLVFDLERPQVRSFLLASAIHWLQEFHFDGLRVDAVASMLYLDYSRASGDWLPNRHGGHENLEAVDFLRTLNDAVADEVPGALMIAEESTHWPGVTRPTREGGLGFSMKWNLGWMNDTLSYLHVDPLHRRHHHRKLTFGALYAHSEAYVLPLSHDEVVHGKGSLAGKPWGPEHARLAQLRLLLALQYAWPGKKLLFMGGEFAQHREWNHDAGLDWPLLDHPAHAGVQRLVDDLNRLYRGCPALHAGDQDPGGFQWLDCHDHTGSTLAFLRRNGAASVLAVFNLSAADLHRHALGVPWPGAWRELLNTDSRHYGGLDRGNAGLAHTQPRPCHGRNQRLTLRLAPFSALWLAPADAPAAVAPPA